MLAPTKSLCVRRWRTNLDVNKGDEYVNTHALDRK